MPYFVITQFEGIRTHDTVPQSLTLHMELQEGHKLHACAQVAKLLRYLHFEAEILHNDIKPDKILLSDVYRKFDCDCNEKAAHVVLTDFGNATFIHHGMWFY